MSTDIGVELSIFVEHGKERAAADFYLAAFGAEETDTYAIDGILCGVKMHFGELAVTVAGSNPNRERMPSNGGPFFPKHAGDVRTVFQIHVGDMDAAFARACAAGAAIRDEIMTDGLGRRIASFFDPFGHIWAVIERTPEGETLTVPPCMPRCELSESISSIP